MKHSNSPSNEKKDIPELISLDERLLNSSEVAALVGKSVAWVVRKRWEGGGIPYRKIGRHVRYQKSAVMNWLNSHPQCYSTSD